MSAAAPIHVERDLLVAMRDGVRLATDVFRPAGGGPWPVLLKRTPYGKKQAALMAAESIADLVDHGYAVVVQDVRGRANSEGCWVPFAAERDDGYDTVAWAAAQPWSSGRVGMFGISYLGLTQLLAAASRPPALGAIVPANAPSDLHRTWVYAAPGVLDLLLSVGWTAATAADTARRRGIHDARLAQIELALGHLLGALRQGPDAARLASDRLLVALDPLFRPPLARTASDLETLAPWLGTWLEHPASDAYWAALAPATYYGQMATPALHVSGWYDPFVRGVIANYLGLREQAATSRARAGQRLIIGPWFHGGLDPCPPHQVGEVDFGPGADVDLPDLQRRWFDAWLRDVDSGAQDEAPVRLFVMGDNRWRDEQAWPLARTTWRRLYLHSQGHANTLAGDGQLSFQLPAATQPADHFAFDPADPLPTLGGAVLPGAVLAGPFDQRPIEHRPDVLVYTSAPLGAALEVTGPVSAELWASSTAPDPDFTARLVDVAPDGRALNVCEGVVRAAFRDGALAPLTPGATCALHIELGPTSLVFQPGHRIRLDVSSSSYPHYPPSPRAAHQTICHTAQHPSHLLLPCIPRGAHAG